MDGRLFDFKTGHLKAKVQILETKAKMMHTASFAKTSKPVVFSCYYYIIEFPRVSIAFLS